MWAAFAHPPRKHPFTPSARSKNTWKYHQRHPSCTEVCGQHQDTKEMKERVAIVEIIESFFHPLMMANSSRELLEILRGLTRSLSRRQCNDVSDL